MGRQRFIVFRVCITIIQIQSYATCHPPKTPKLRVNLSRGTNNARKCELSSTPLNTTNTYPTSPQTLIPPPSLTCNVYMRLLSILEMSKGYVPNLYCQSISDGRVEFVDVRTRGGCKVSARGTHRRAILLIPLYSKGPEQYRNHCAHTLVRARGRA
jgi:hypothetical protein